MATLNIPTSDQMEKLLDAKMDSDYPAEYVELGENWEIIAAIFFKAGFESSKEQ